jgi:hypothetical protein
MAAAASFDALRQARSDRIAEQSVGLFFGHPAQSILFAAELVLLSTERVLPPEERVPLAAQVALLMGQGLGFTRRAARLLGAQPWPAGRQVGRHEIYGVCPTDGFPLP